MSARNSLNLRRWGKEWGGPLDMARCWKIECFEFTTEGSYWAAIADVKRKRIPNSGGSYRKTSRAKTCTDTRHRQQISVRRTQCTRWNVVFLFLLDAERIISVDQQLCGTPQSSALLSVLCLHEHWLFLRQHIWLSTLQGTFLWHSGIAVTFLVNTLQRNAFSCCI